ncbi:MAG: hypothetical protein ACI3YB_04310 [Prevotella sp.]
MKIHQIIFSPTGGTRRACQYISEGMGRDTVITDLSVKSECIRLPELSADDVAVIAMPVYMPRDVPMPRIAKSWPPSEPL